MPKKLKNSLAFMMINIMTVFWNHIWGIHVNPEMFNISTDNCKKFLCDKWYFCSSCKINFFNIFIVGWACFPKANRSQLEPQSWFREEIKEARAFIQKYWTWIQNTTRGECFFIKFFVQIRRWWQTSWRSSDDKCADFSCLTQIFLSDPRQFSSFPVKILYKS